MKVPSATAISVVIPAIRNEFFIAVARSGFANGCPGVEREALPGEVEAALGVVEREHHDHEEDEEVEQRQRAPDPERPRARLVDAAGPRGFSSPAMTSATLGGLDRHQIAASVRLRAPRTRA